MGRVKIDILERAASALEDLQETQLVEASSLTRILRMVGHDDRQENDVDVLHPFAILTAFRSDAGSEVNDRRLSQMEDLLKRAGVKTYRLTGNWLEPPEGMTFDEAEIAQKLVHIKEDSVFCVPEKGLDMDFEAFEAVVTRQADRYEQDAIIMSDGQTVWLRFKDGHLKSLGDHIQVDVLEHAYKTMRNQKEHPFVFAAAVVSDFRRTRGDEWAYHVTQKSLLPGIEKDGLRPTPHQHTNGEAVIFIEPDEENVAVYHQPPNTVMLRFKVDGFGTTDDGENVYYDAVSPEDLEIKTKIGFIPLSEYRDYLMSKNKTAGEKENGVLDIERGYVEASGLSRLLRRVGNPTQEPMDPSKPVDTEPMDPSKPFDLKTNPMKNPKQIKVQTIMPFAVFTAWKDKVAPEGMTYEQAEQQGKLIELTEKDNRARNRELLNTLNAKKMGAYRLVGYFQYPPEGMNYEDARKEGKLLPASREESFFVIKPQNMDYEEFKSMVSDLALKEYAQTSYIICDGNEIFEISSTGQRSLGNKLIMSKIEQAYSRMRGHGDMPFVFAGMSTPTDMGQMRYFASIGLVWVQPPTAEQQQLMARLRDLVVSAMKFSEFKSHGGTSKMWIDPKNRPIPLDGMHYEWLMENAAFVRKAFNLPDMPKFGVHDEQAARIWALMNGFTRVNYNPRNGNVTFDTCEKFWTPKRQDVCSMIIADNADDLYSITVNVYSDDGKQLVRDGTQDVKSLDDAAAKVEAIPFVEAKRVKLIAECLRRFGI